MMRMALVYVATLVAMMALDAVFLSAVGIPMFKAALGDLLLQKPRVLSAVVFYLVYAAGIVILVSMPTAQPLARIALRGAVLGFVAYGTYEFTNYATLRPWTPTLMATDLIWGTVATALAAMGGVAIGGWLARLIGVATTGNG